MNGEKLTCSVKEMAGMLGIGMNAAYTLANSDGFPAIRIGKKLIISVDGLREWVASNVGQAVM